MTVPLVILAVLSVIGGWIGWPASLGGSNRFEHFLEPVTKARVEHHVEAAAAHAASMEYLLMAASVAIALLGIWLARMFYVRTPAIPERLAANWPRLHQLIYRKYYVDEIYDAAFVNRTKDLGTTFAAFDSGIIDGLGVDGTGWLTRLTSRLSIWWDTWIVDGLVNFVGWIVRSLSLPVRIVQTGIVSNYALLIVVGMVLLLGYYVRVMHNVVR